MVRWTSEKRRIPVPPRPGHRRSRLARWRRGGPLRMRDPPRDQVLGSRRSRCAHCRQVDSPGVGRGPRPRMNGAVCAAYTAFQGNDPRREQRQDDKTQHGLRQHNLPCGPYCAAASRPAPAATPTSTNDTRRARDGGGELNPSRHRTTLHRCAGLQWTGRGTEGVGIPNAQMNSRAALHPLHASVRVDQRGDSSNRADRHPQW